MATIPNVRVYAPGADITAEATATVTGRRFVRISGNRATGGNLSVAHATAAARAFGVARHDATTGELVSIARGGVVKVTTGAVIAAGADVEVGRRQGHHQVRRGRCRIRHHRCRIPRRCRNRPSLRGITHHAERTHPRTQRPAPHRRRCAPHPRHPARSHRQARRRSNSAAAVLPQSRRTHRRWRPAVLRRQGVGLLQLRCRKALTGQ